jgi:hypothetical protein
MLASPPPAAGEAATARRATPPPRATLATARCTHPSSIALPSGGAAAGALAAAAVAARPPTTLNEWTSALLCGVPERKTIAGALHVLLHERSLARRCGRCRLARPCRWRRDGTARALALGLVPFG